MSTETSQPSTLVAQFLSADDQSSGSYTTPLAALLDSKKLTLLGFIQLLGPHLTSDTDQIRLKSVQLLGETLAQTKNTVSRHDVPVLSSFLAAQMDDKPVVQSALHSLTVLVQFSVFKSANISEVLNTIKTKYEPSKHLAKVRYEAFALLDAILPKIDRTDDIVAIEFVTTFIYIANGEKDPRNLIMSFNLNKAIAESFKFDPQSHKDILADLFDVAFCYFPISFTPPANDPYGITASDLKLKLRAALTSQTLYSDDLFPSLIEKLTSSNPVVRNDVLKTMKLAVIKFDAKDIISHWVTIWNSLKYEILHNEVSIFKPEHDEIIPVDFDSKIDDTDEFKPLYLTLDIVKELTIKFSHVEDSTKIDHFLNSVFTELKDNLSKVSDKVFTQSVLLISVIGMASIYSYNKVVDYVFSYPIWGKFIGVEKDTQEQDEIKVEPQQEVEIKSSDLADQDFTLTMVQKRALVDNLGFIFSAYLPADNNHLFTYKDILLMFNGQILRTVSPLEKTLKTKTISQLSKLAVLPGFLDHNEWANVLYWFNEILQFSIKSNPNSWEKDPVVIEIKLSLVKIMNKNWQRGDLVVEKILPTLLEALQEAQTNINLFSKTLSFIGDICINPQFLETLSVRLLGNLENYAKTNQDLYIATVSLLVDMVNKTEQTKAFLMNSWYKSFIPRFSNSLFKGISNPDFNKIESVIEASGDLLAIIIKYVDKDQHPIILNEFTKIFIQENLILEKFDIQVNIFTKILSSIDRKIELDQELMESLLSKTIKLLQTTSRQELETNSYIRLGYLQLISLLVNKFEKTKSGSVDNILQSRFQQLVNDNDLISNEIFAWTIKGLILKLDPRGFEYLQKTLVLLTSQETISSTLNQFICQILKIVTVDLPIFTNATQFKKMTKLISGVQCYNVRSLYKQRLFSSTLPILLEGFSKNQTSDLSSKSVYLVALANLLANVPSSVLMPHFQDFTPMVLSSLSLQDTSILISSLSTLKIIAEENLTILVPHLSKFIPKLTNIIVTPNRVNTEEIRKKATECLIVVFQQGDKNQLLKYKPEVLRSLVVALDDKKRSVRKLVSDLRQILYELR